jgi:hypothetical protein
MDLGLMFSIGQRSRPQEGVDRVPDLENEHSSSRVYTFHAGLGLWRGLSARLTFPMLEVAFSEGDDSGSDFGIGDLSVLMHYGWSLGSIRSPLRIGISAGSFLPTGGSVQSDIPSNPNFVSGTVDPQLGLDLTYDLEFGLGFYARGLARLVIYENGDDYQAGHSLVYMAGLHYRFFRSLMPALGLTFLNKLPDQQNGAQVGDTGGDWVYINPSLSYVFTSGPVAGLRLMVTAQVPVYQFVHGAQLGEDFSLTFGVAYGFELFEPN